MRFSLTILVHQLSPTAGLGHAGRCCPGISPSLALKPVPMQPGTHINKYLSTRLRAPGPPHGILERPGFSGSIQDLGPVKTMFHIDPNLY